MDYSEFVAWLQENYPEDYDELLGLDSDGNLKNGFSPEDPDLMGMWDELFQAFSEEQGTHVPASQESQIRP